MAYKFLDEKTKEIFVESRTDNVLGDLVHFTHLNLSELELELGLHIDEL